MIDSGQSARSSSSFDWSASRLGDPGQWPWPLRMAADLLFNLPLPALLVWGRDMTVVFNDAYAALAGPGYGKVPGGNVPPVMPPPLAGASAELERAWDGEAAIAGARSLSFAGGRRRACGNAHDLHFTPLRAAGRQRGRRAVRAGVGRGHRAARGSAAGPLRILVVEDNLDSQYLVCEMLRAFGHHADGVGHPDDALAHLAAGRYDVLFTDVSLPGMSGVELARKAVADAPAMQVIFASGYGDTLLRHLEFPYLSLQKPYELDQLQTALDKVSGAEAGACLSGQRCASNRPRWARIHVRLAKYAGRGRVRFPRGSPSSASTATEHDPDRFYWQHPPTAPIRPSAPFRAPAQETR
jgi:CheY-like chemotaxis protein